jgi:hypothetical protein
MSQGQELLLAASLGDLPAVKIHLTHIARVDVCMDQVRCWSFPTRPHARFYLGLSKG